MRILLTGGSGFIGTNLIDHLLQKGGAEILNLDINPPLSETHNPLWQKSDIRDAQALADAVRDFQPSHVVHLAAIATFYADDALLQSTNIQGTANLLDAVMAHAPQARILMTSTQYVNGPGTPFDDDLVFHPVNEYGRTKAESERLTRSEKYAGLDWIITRPTNIWGAFHPRFPTEIWKYIRRGFYLHPGHEPIIRVYGYVGNLVRQIEILLEAPAEKVRHRVFYLTDPDIDSYEFLNSFSMKLRGRPLPRLPYPLLKMLALVGDAITAVGLKAPFRSDRLHRMTTGHTARYESLWAESGYRGASVSEAVDETIAWLKRHHPRLYP